MADTEMERFRSREVKEAKGITPGLLSDVDRRKVSFVAEFPL